MSDEPPPLGPAPDPAAPIEPTAAGGGEPPLIEATPLPVALVEISDPPLLAAAPPPPPGKVPAWLVLATVFTGILEFLLCVVVSGNDPQADNVGYRIGFVVGGVLAWPLIVLGLFSIGRRFRNARSRTIILLAAFGLGVLGQVGQLGQVPRARPARPTAETKAKADADEADADEPSAQSDDDLRVNVPLPPPATRRSNLDFSPGSDARLVKLIDHAQEDRYHDTVAAYADECAARPDDAVLALERVKFIERFANSEDNTIESTTGDLRAATRYLTARFPKAPGTILYKLRNYQSAGFEARADAAEDLVPEWADGDRASFFLLRAQSAEAKKKYAAAEKFAASSFKATPTVAAGLVLARTAHRQKHDAESRRALADPVFATASAWEKKQKMELLLDLGRTAEAMALYRELTKDGPALLNDESTATRLARAGKIGAAREIFAALPVNKWNSDRLNRARFDFEMAHGDAGQAAAAYRAMRAGGLKVDPFMRDRLALFWAHPGEAFKADDFAGGLVLLFMVVLLAAAPLALLLPIHYLSLRRAQRGAVPGWSNPAWGLREAWILLAVLLLTESLGLWIWQPGLLRSWWAPGPAAAHLESGALIPMQCLLWVALGTVIAFLYQRSGGWRLLGPGKWGVGQSVGISLGLAIAGRLLLGVVIAAWPQAFRSEIPGLQSATADLCVGLLDHFGPAGLILAAAVFVPMLEEMVFRGVLLQSFAKHLPFAWANLVQAVLFAAVHESWVLAPFFIGFACVNGLLVRRAGGLLPAILLHAFNNLVVCVVLVVTRTT